MIEEPTYRDIYSEHECYVWFCLQNGIVDLDVEMIGEQLDVEMIGEQPEWFSEELSAAGADGFLGADHYGEWSRRARWALEHGIAPGQPFLLWISGEYVTTSSYEYGDETDLEISQEVIAIEQRSPAESLAAWDEFLKDRARYFYGKKRREERLRQRQRTDTSAMFILFDMFYTDYYDGMSPPDGIRATLCSNFAYSNWAWKNNHYQTLLSGEDRKRGEQGAAVEDLIKQAAKHLPHLSAETIRTLPKKWPLL